MDFAFTSDQEALRGAAREWLADRWPIDTVIKEIDRQERELDRAAWQELAGLGWLDSELTLLDQAVLAEESGDALLPLPWWSSVALAGPVADEELRAAVATGERAATLAYAEPGATSSQFLREAAGGTTEVDGSGRLTGVKVLVPDLDVVTDVVVMTSDGVHVVDLVEHPECVVRRSTIDRSRPLGELRLDRTPARRLADRDPAAVAATVQDGALALLACEAVGVASRALSYAAEHAKQRQQFGRVIGTYQAVSHRVANTYLETELARSLAYWAAWAVSEGDDQARLAVAAAKADAGEAAVFACEQAIQVHGGIGFTWEHPLHRYYKRGQWIDSFEGAARQHLATIAGHLLGVG